MSYKSILLFLDDGKSNDDRVAAAVTMAKSHDAYLTGAALKSLTPEALNSTNDKVAAVESKRMAGQLVENFSNHAKAAGIKFETIIIPGSWDTSANKMAHYGRNADLIMLAQPNPDSRNYTRMVEFAEEVMLYSGRPVLFMPYIGANKIPFKKALISWDGTPAATRATYDAIPILKRAEDVTILVVQSKKQLDSKSDDQAEALSRNLERHGIHTHVERIAPIRYIPSTR